MSQSFTERVILAQQAIGTIRRDATNPRFGSKYATLDAIIEQVRPALAAHGLLLTQHVQQGYVSTCVSGGSADEKLVSEVPVCAPLDDPQRYGAALTYARRYGIATLLCLATDDDDDGNSAQPEPRSSSSSTPAPARPQAAFVPPTAPAPADATSGTGNDLERLGATQIHFGKNKGTPLNAITMKSLTWYANEWEPRFDERTGRLNATDEALKLAARQFLDAMLHPGQATYVPADIAPAVIADEADGIPF